MKRYEISILPKAMQDMRNLYSYIAFEVMMPLAALRYYEGIIDTINRLAYLPKAYPVSEIASVQRCYGPEARTVRYKKMTVIYNIVSDIVVVRRVVAGSMVF